MKDPFMQGLLLHKFKILDGNIIKEMEATVSLSRHFYQNELLGRASTDLNRNLGGRKNSLYPNSPNNSETYLAHHVVQIA